MPPENKPTSSERRRNVKNKKHHTDRSIARTKKSVWWWQITENTLGTGEEHTRLDTSYNIRGGFNEGWHLLAQNISDRPGAPHPRKLYPMRHAVSLEHHLLDMKALPQYVLAVVIYCQQCNLLTDPGSIFATIFSSHVRPRNTSHYTTKPHERVSGGERRDSTLLQSSILIDLHDSIFATD